MEFVLGGCRVFVVQGSSGLGFLCFFFASKGFGFCFRFLYDGFCLCFYIVWYLSLFFCCYKSSVPRGMLKGCLGFIRVVRR